MSDSVPDGWKSVKLGDVAEEISDRVDNPSKSGYDRFVGLEHLDSGELTVRRWGSTVDLLSAMKLFKSGDILIGRRNAYLKRASKAEFDGVCSGDAYVVREKQGAIVEGLLPIILNSDSFWDYTIAHASGTMSKRAKWRDLADYLFMLPLPEEQQHRIAITLWAVEDCVVKGERLLAAAERAKQVLMRELFSEGIGHTEFQQVKGFSKVPEKWDVLQLREIINEPIRNGAFIQQNESEISVPFLNVVDVYKNPVVKISDLQKINCTQPDFDNYQLRENDLLYVRSSLRRQGIAQCCMINSLPERTIFDCHLMRVRLNAEKCNSKYLLYYSISDNGRKQLINISKTTTMSTMDQKDLGSFSIPIPPLPEQRQIAAILTSCDETIASARANIAATRALKMKMINEMLNPGN
jgi:type I restriction enzyme S subunit